MMLFQILLSLMKKENKLVDEFKKKTQKAEEQNQIKIKKETKERKPLI